MAITTTNSTVIGATYLRRNSGINNIVQSSSGYLNTPYVPASMAYAGTPGTTGQNPFTFTATDSNNGSYFSTSTYRFTVPVAGTYLVLLNVLYRGNTGSPSNGEIAIRVNGSNITGRGNCYCLGGFGSYHCQMFTSAILSLAANDYITGASYSNTSNGSDYYLGNALGHFSVVKIG